MKHLLSPEQSATLISKGISADKASMFAWQKVRDGKGNPLSKKEKNCRYNHGITLKKGMMVCGLEHIEYTPIFTLADILSLLPKHIGDFGNLMMAFNNRYGKWDVCYELSEYMQCETELIDALFSTLCWAIGHGHIDLTK